MRLLFLTSRLPYPPNRGDRLRAFNFIRTLSAEHEIHLLSFIAGEAELPFIAPLREYCREVQVVPLSSLRSALTVGLNLWRSQPLQALYYRSAAMQKRVDQILAQNHFDAIYAHLFRMAPYIANAPRHQPSTANHQPPYRIIDLTDVISQELIRSMPYRGKLSKLVYAFERPRIERYERWVANHFEESWLISAHDRDILAAQCPQANLQVIRNGVDTETLRPLPGLETPNSLIFVGHMGVFHNVDAANVLAREILPRVRAQIPGAALKLVGAAPRPEVRALASLPGVEVTGFVDDLNAALNQAAVFIAPLRFAAGVQNKVLEAMAAGRPVITTNLVNQGLGAQSGRDLLTAETAPEIADLALQLLRNPEMRQSLGQAARQFVQANYRWDFAAERLRILQDQFTNLRGEKP